MSLSNEAKDFFKSLGKVDVIIGIPSYNNAETIGFVIEQAAKGVQESYSSLKSVIFNSDGGSTDGTPQIVKNKAEKYNLNIVSYPYTGIPGKGSSIKAILEASEIVDSSATILLDSDLRSIKPFWTSLFLNAILKDEYDYITPYYIRHKYDGTITNNIVYPLLVGIFGTDIRQPIGGDFGMSRNAYRMLLRELTQDSSEDVYKFGIDIFMTVNAIVNRCKLLQLRLGTKIHNPKDPSASLLPMFTQVTKTLFNLIIKHADSCKDINKITKVEIKGKKTNEKPEEVKIDKEALSKGWKDGYLKYRWIYEKVLNKESLVKLKETGIDSEAWVNILYDFIAFYKKNKEKDLVINALAPLYLGRTLGFIIETKNLSDDAAEMNVLKETEVFWYKRKRFFANLQK